MAHWSHRKANKASPVQTSRHLPEEKKWGARSYEWFGMRVDKINKRLTLSISKEKYLYITTADYALPLYVTLQTK